MSTPQDPRRLDEAAWEDEGIPGTADEEAYPGGSDIDGYGPPRDYPLGVEEFGTTAAEEIAGESLDARLARELPDVTDPVTPRGGSDELDLDAPPGQGTAEEELTSARLVAPDEGSHEDTEKDMIATETADTGGLSAEESAMHLDPRS
jgi:hypothetical protein